MTQHWWHVGVSYLLTLIVFGGLAIGATVRHRAARRLLATLDPRGERS